MTPQEPARAVDVYHVDLDGAPADADQLHEVLDARERATIAIRKGDSARRYAVAHSALRSVVGAHLDRDPATIEYSFRCAVCGGPHGKPALADGELVFSLTHSGPVAAIAVARSGSLGIDVERVHPRRYLDLLARRTMSTVDHATWLAQPESQRLRAFLESWTRKEAYLKAIGVGLTRPLREVEFPETFHVANLDGPDGVVVGALAFDAAPTVTQHRWRADAFSANGGTEG